MLLLTCDLFSYVIFFISKQLLWELFFCISNSKTFPTRLTDAFQDTLQTGISIATYVTQTANAPSEYGIILYLAHNKDSNKWYIAVAFGTATNEAFISRKINSGPWSNWEKISVTK